MNVHIQTYKTKRPQLTCIVCKKGFKSKQALQSHIRNFHSNDAGSSKALIYKCGTCEEAFACYGLLKQHLDIHKTNKCCLCDKSFRRVDELQKHCNLHRFYKCEICNAAFRYNISLKYHNCVAPQRVGKVSSESLGFLSKTGKQYYGTENITESGNASLRNDQTYLCSSCGKVVAEGCSCGCHDFDVPEIIYACKVCSKRFDRIGEFEQHSCLQIDGKPYCYEEVLDTECSDPDASNCVYCSRGVAKGEVCTCQDSGVPDTQPHICQMCSQAFALLNDFERHRCCQVKVNPEVVVASDSKPRICQSCFKAFPLLSDFERHACCQVKVNPEVLVTSDSKPHVCQSCFKAFLLLSDFERHACLQVNNDLEVINCGSTSLDFDGKAKDEPEVTVTKNPSNDKTFYDKFGYTWSWENPHECQIVQPPKTVPHFCSICGQSSLRGQCHCDTDIAGEVPYVCEVCSKAFQKIDEFKEHRCDTESFGYGLYYLTDQKTCFYAQEMNQGYLLKTEKRIKTDPDDETSVTVKRPCTREEKLCEHCGKGNVKGKICNCAGEDFSYRKISTLPKNDEETCLCTQCGDAFLESRLHACENKSARNSITNANSKACTKTDLNAEISLCTRCGSSFVTGGTCRCNTGSVICDNNSNSVLESMKGKGTCLSNLCDGFGKAGKTFCNSENCACEVSLLVLKDRSTTGDSETRYCLQCRSFYVKGDFCKCRKSFNQNNVPSTEIDKDLVLQVKNSATVNVGESKEMQHCRHCGSSFVKGSACTCENKSADHKKVNNTEDEVVEVSECNEMQHCMHCDGSFVKGSPCKCEILSFKDNSIEISDVVPVSSSEGAGTCVCKLFVGGDGECTGNCRIFASFQNPFVCTVCSKQFVMSEDLQQHFKGHFRFANVPQEKEKYLKVHFEICPYQQLKPVDQCEYCRFIYHYVFAEEKLDQMVRATHVKEIVSQNNIEQKSSKLVFYFCSTCKVIYRLEKPLEENVAVACLACGGTLPSCRRSSKTSTSRNGSNVKISKAPRKISPALAPTVRTKDRRTVRRYDCGLCDQRFSGAGDLKSHFTDVHYSNSQASSRRSNYILWKEWRGEPAFACSNCHRLRGDRVSYERHLTWHKEQSANTVKCNWCALHFYEKRDLSRHLRLHSVEVPYRCRRILF